MSHRRIIRRPADLADADWSRLVELLSAAVVRQRDWESSSPHVLRFTGDLEPLEDGAGLFIEHEPAECLPLSGLFDSSAPAVRESELLRVTVALFDGLRAAHAGVTGQAGAHGAVCPGVILFAPDGELKLTDFGFASAFCSVLGTDAYVDLVIHPSRQSSSSLAGGTRTTGAWETVGRDDFERDGRICAFIDPEKYGGHTLHAFEPASDIIGAAFVLHLLAEHRHPYLPDDPNAHRLVEMCEFMSMARYNGARRRDLRTSENPGTRLWCDLIAKALARLPQDRPSATQVVDALREHVVPEDRGEALRSRLDSLQEALREGDWNQVREVASGVLESDHAPTDVVQKANALVVLAEANVLTATARDAIAGPQWALAEEPLGRVLAMPGLPEELISQARRLHGTVRASLLTGQTLDEVEARSEKVDEQDPFAAVEMIQALLDRLSELEDADRVVPPVSERLAVTQKALSDRLKAALPAARDVMESSRAAATEWVEKLEAAAKDGDWEELERLATAKPDLRHWPDDLLSRAEAANRSLRDHRTEQARAEAIHADHAKAELWLDQLKLAVHARRWDRAEHLLAERPGLAHWSDDVMAKVDELRLEVAAGAKRQSDEGAARAWCAEIRKAVEDEDFETGADLLEERPALDQWPADVLDEVGRYEQQLAKWVDAARGRRERQAREAREIEEWLQRAELAARNEQWQETLDILDEPPGDVAPRSEAYERVAVLREACQSKLEAKSRDRLRARSDAVEALAGAFARKVAAEHAVGLIELDSIGVRMGDAQRLADHESGDWTVQIGLRRREEPQGAEAEIAFPFHLRIDEESRRIGDDDGSLSEQLGNKFQEVVGRLQKEGIAFLQDGLRGGLFPDAQITVVPGDPAPTLAANFRLLGGDSARGSFDAELTWEPATLAWTYADARGFARRMVEVAEAAVTEELQDRLLDSVEELRRYKPVLAIRVAASHAPDPIGPVDGLDLEVRLVIQPGDADAPETLLTFHTRCERIGETACEANLAPAVVELNRVVLTAQRQSSESIRADLLTRVRDAGAKLKLSVQPAPKEHPVDDVNFVLTARKQDPVSLTATWDTGQFTYVLAGDWERKLEEFLGELARAEKGKRPPWDAIADKWPKGVPRPGKRLAIGIGAVFVALLIWAAWPKPADPTAVLAAEFEATSEQYFALENSLNAPSHAVLTSLIESDQIDALADDLDALRQRVPPDGTELADRVDLRLEQVRNWQAKLNAYALGFEKPGEDVALAIQKAAAAQDAWATPEVEALLDTLRKSQTPERPDPTTALTTEFEATDAPYDALGKMLASPSHADLRSLNQGKRIETLARDLNALADRVPATAVELAGRISVRLAEVADWQRKLATYADAFEEPGDDIALAIQKATAARDLWATPEVEELLRTLRESRTPDPMIALAAEFEATRGDYAELERKLKAPSHADLTEVIGDGRVGVLIDELRSLRTRVPDEAAELAGRVDSRLEKLTGWKTKLGTYATAFAEPDDDISRTIQKLTDARDAWATPEVEALLSKLGDVQDQLDSASRWMSDGDWRGARFFLTRAEEAAVRQDLEPQASAAIETLQTELARTQRESMEPIVAEARTWLSTVSPPADAVAQLSESQAATTARGLLDRLDLDYPTTMGEGTIVDKAMRQQLFPWTILTEPERAVVSDLLNWVTVSLPIGVNNDVAAVRIELAFVPADPSVGVLDPLWLSRTEVTVGQYTALMGGAPQTGAGEFFEEMRSDDTHPVAFIPVADTRELCLKLRERLQDRAIVRIPTAQEWTYAAATGSAAGRGRLEPARYTADGKITLDPTRMNFESDEDPLLAPPGHEDGFGRYAPVGSYPPNRWLLHDMLGNVSEWVEVPGSSRLASVGGSFRETWDADHAQPTPRGQGRPLFDVGVRLAVLPTPP